MTKKLLLAAIAGIFVFSLHAQVVITRNDMPDPGDTIRTSFTALTPPYNYETDGADVEWDFSDLMPAFQVVDTFVNVNLASLPFAYWLVFNPIASIASPILDFDLVPGVDVSDIYQFYNETNSLFSFVGLALTLNGVPLPLAYDNPDVLYTFPVTYLSTDSSESSFELSLPGVGYYASNRTRVNHVDAWGTITTPYGTFESIRVKSLLNTFDSVYVEDLQMGEAIIREVTEYKWLANNMGLPVMQVDVEGPLVTARYIDSARLITGVEHLATQIPDFSLYPNPTSSLVYSQFELQYSGNVRIDIFDLAGRLKATPVNRYFTRGNYTYPISIQDFNPGIYIVKISMGEKNVVRKLVVN